MRRRQIIAAVALLAGLAVAGCSSSPAVNLKQDEINIAVDSSEVAKDLIVLQPYEHPTTSQAIDCASSDTTPPTLQCPGTPADKKALAQLKADELKLRVAKDQLKKDESG